MIKIIQSKWVASGLGLGLYLLTTVLCWHPEGAVEHTPTETKAKTTGPSWTFQNPEVDLLIAELKREKEALAEREKAMTELSARLQAERLELNQLTQSVSSLQVELDRNVLRIQEQESANLKRLAKVYAGMEPQNAVPILRQMDESTVVKIVALMKDGERGPLLEAMGSLGEGDAKLAATLSERLRLTFPQPLTPQQGAR